jgi:P27 family predicted phage terminase small subunit
MSKGRKAIPTKIINMRGGTKLTHRPPRREEAKPPEKMPPCPKHLDAGARKEWRRAGRILKAIGLLSEIDLAVFAGYCQAYSTWKQASEAIAREGMMDRDRFGLPIVNPHYRIANTAWDQMIKAGREIGMSPSARASIKVPAKQPEDELESFLARRTNGEK